MGAVAVASGGRWSLLSWHSYLAIGFGVFWALLIILPAWRRGIYFIFAWLLAEDVIRRLLPGQPVELQLVKEALLLWTYLAFVVSRRKEGRLLWTPPFMVSLLCFSTVVVMDALNPGLPGLLVPALGVRIYLWYIPLLWIGYYAFRNRGELVRFGRRLVALAIPLGSLAIIQYVFWDQLPGWLQPLEGAHTFHSAAWEYQGESVGFESKLPSSVFGSAHRFATYSLFLFFFGVGVWAGSASRTRQRKRVWLGLSILASLVSIVAAGTRMAMLLVLVGLVLLVLEPVLARRGRFLRRRARARQALTGVLLGAAFGAILLIFSNTATFFFRTTGGSVEAHWQEFTRGQLPLVLKKAAWFGFGTGSLSQGLTYVPGGEESFEFASRESQGVGVEYGLAKITWELGVLGLLAFLSLWIGILRSLWKSLRALRNSESMGLARALGIFCLLVFVAFLKGHYYFGDGTTLVVYWFGMGIFFSLRRLDRIETARARFEKARALAAAEASTPLKEVGNGGALQIGFT